MNDAEILIVGSGPAGINVAWPLVKRGKRVIMVDGVAPNKPDFPNMDIGEFRSDPRSGQYTYGSNYQGLFLDKNISPKFATPLGQEILNKNDYFDTPLKSNNFFGQRSRIPGGQSQIWGAFCSAFDSSDLKGYPINHEDLFRAYKAVAERIGLSGANDDLGSFHGDYLQLQPSVFLTDVIAFIMKQYKNGNFDKNNFLLGLARNAVITKQMTGRSGCNTCGLCLYGCSRKSIYSSSMEIAELARYSNFRYLANTVVTKLISLDGDSKEVEVNGNDRLFTDKLILGAGTISTTALILEYCGVYDKKIPLLSNPTAAMAFIAPNYFMSRFSDKSFGLGQLSYRIQLRDDYATGVIYGADTLPVDSFSRRLPFSRSVSLRICAAVMPALIPVTTYLPSKFSSNYISLKRCSEGYEINLGGVNTSSAVNALISSRKKLSKFLKMCGAYYVPGSFNILMPGADAHLAGTIPMGGKGVLGTTSNGELNAHANVFLVDGSILPSLPAKHCTFTIMANAYRIGKFLADR